ncbi:MAG: gliding motility lipoprotein GldH [Paludibacteraceae bacterium]|nr:gliding motility lipoprotein GldH [Paludibacteraceae bacterium]
MFKKFLAFSIFIWLFACVSKDVFFQYEKIPTEGWHQDSAMHFSVVMRDTIGKYNMYVNVRNRGEYPHQNLWLFIEQQNPDSSVTTDTINFYLADERGKWLGSGVGSVFEMPVLYRQQIQFPDSGAYHFSFRQGMRDSVLIGLNDLGLRIEKAN